MNWPRTRDGVVFCFVLGISCYLLNVLLTPNPVENQLCWQGVGLMSGQVPVVGPTCGPVNVIAGHAGAHRGQV